MVRFQCRETMASASRCSRAVFTRSLPICTASLNPWTALSGAGGGSSCGRRMLGSTSSTVRGRSVRGEEKASACSTASPTGVLSRNPPVDEVAPAELELLAAPDGAVGGTGQTNERLAGQGPRALIGGDLALPIPARAAALADRSCSEGDREGRRG